MTPCLPFTLADGVLNTAEFKKHLEQATALDLDNHDIDAMSSQYGKNLTLGMTVGKVHTECIILNVHTEGT
jgi:pentose-5-phosphate-3-epimerase